MKKEVIIGLIIVLAVSVYVFINFSGSKDNDVMKKEVVIKEEDVKQNMEEIVTYTMENIEAEVSEGKCLIVINNNVYDMTDFPEDHPGGSDKILNNCGKDGTTVFKTQGGKGEHSDEAIMRLDDFYVGDLSE